MRQTTILTAAIAAAVMTSGIAMMGVQAAVTADCTHDYDLLSIEPPLARSLGTTGNDVGRIIVDDSADVEVTVSLESDDDILLFGVFYLNGMSCDAAEPAGFTLCSDDESLDSGADPTPVRQICGLDAPSQNTRSYFFVFENGGSSSLQYKAWKSG